MAAKRTKRSDGRHQVSVTYEDPETGLKRRKVFYGRTQAEASKKAQEARDRLSAGGPIRDASATVSEWLADWRDTFLKASDRSASTKDLYARLTRRWVEPTIGTVSLDRLRPVDVTRVMLVMEQGGMSGSTRRNVYAALRGALDDAVRNGLLMDNPVHKVKRPRADPHEAIALEAEQVAKFLKALDGLRYADVLRLILGTGVRRGEALGLRWKDINLDRAEARISGSLVRQGRDLALIDTKTLKSRRTISLSPAVVALLKKQKAEQAKERLRAANFWTGSGYVFTTDTGAPADPRNLLRAVKIASARADLPQGIGVHTLRHTYATTALLNGVPLHVVSRNLGHTSIAITADVYGHLTDAAAHDAAATVSAALGL